MFVLHHFNLCFSTIVIVAALFFSGCEEQSESSQIIQLPDIEDILVEEPNRILIEVDQDKVIRLGEEVHTTDSLATALRELLKEKESSVILVQVDQAIEYSTVLPVMTAIQSAGYEDAVHLVATGEAN